MVIENLHVTHRRLSRTTVSVVDGPRFPFRQWRRQCCRAAGLALLSLVFLLPFGRLGAETIQGQLELLTRNGKRPSKSAQVREAVVFYLPDDKISVRPLEGGAELVTRQKTFEPRVLNVTVGTTVRFPNDDPILHNVFSVSGENRFDLGLYNKGPGEDWTFRTPGVVRVFCNVHSDMVAFVNVLPSPYFAVPDSAGRYTIDNVPKGSGMLTVWHPRSDPLALAIEVSGRLRQDLELRITRPRLPQHLNKIGKPYSPSDYR